MTFTKYLFPLGVFGLVASALPPADALEYSGLVKFADTQAQNQGAGVFDFSFNYNGVQLNGGADVEIGHRWGVEGDFTTLKTTGGAKIQPNKTFNYENYNDPSGFVGPVYTGSAKSNAPTAYSQIGNLAELGTTIPTTIDPPSFSFPAENVAFNSYFINQRTANIMDIVFACASGSSCDKRATKTPEGYSMAVRLQATSGSWLNTSDLPLSFTVLDKTATGAGNNSQWCAVTPGGLATNNCSRGGENNRVEFDLISFQDTNVEEVPAPLPALGLAAGFAYSRKLRRRMHAVKR